MYNKFPARYRPLHYTMGRSSTGDGSQKQTLAREPPVVDTLGPEGLEPACGT